MKNDRNASTLTHLSKRSNHTIDKCFKLHGYPPNYEFKGKEVKIAAAVLFDDSVQKQRNGYEHQNISEEADKVPSVSQQ